MDKIRYAKGPLVYLYDRQDLKTRRKELLWGDWLRIGADIDAEWSSIRWGQDDFAIRKVDYQEERILELIFLDVGQGDGCILTTPDTGGQERILIVDAGDGDNMANYLNYRFRDFKNAFRFHAAIATHPDKDHYLGFQKILENPQISFDHLYHNGLMERPGKQPLGKVDKGFLTELCRDTAAARALYGDPARRGGMLYPKLIWTALDSGRCGAVTMLSTEHGHKEGGRTWLPGFAPSDAGELSIEVLGPVVETAPNGKQGLRTFAKSPNGKSMDKGKTKNGHSVLLRLQYRDFAILFGGDLNTPAEHFLIRHYGNAGQAPNSLAETRQMVERARARFTVDLMKCCHHGASDVTDEFLEATAPAAYVVSSGDEEGHVHPRPDLLGLLGKKGRGPRPLLLCTELLRSTREREPAELRKKLDKLNRQIPATADPVLRQEKERQREELLDQLFKRNVGVYGAINLRTDGRRAVIAFRNEQPEAVARWFCYELKKDAEGRFQVVGMPGH